MSTVYTASVSPVMDHAAAVLKNYCLFFVFLWRRRELIFSPYRVIWYQMPFVDFGVSANALDLSIIYVDVVVCRFVS